MAVYTKAFKWRSFKHPESKLFNHIFSFSEIKFKELIKTTQTNHSLEKHNLRHLMRVYPGITRVSSNNFDPIMFWTKGVQMVALNWQTYGISLLPVFVLKVRSRDATQHSDVSSELPTWIYFETYFVAAF